MNKLLIIGFDGATFDLIRPWAEEGHLPNLAQLMQNGVHGDLRSTLPPVTSPAWPTFMTGCNPGKHGVFDFIQPKGANFSLVNSTRIKQPTIWQRLSRVGLRVGVLNVPVTYPPQPLNGFMVTGILSPKSAEISYPADLIGRYEAELGKYRVAPNIQYKAGIETEFCEDIYSLIHAHGNWALKLMQNEAWDVLMVHFIAMDIMKHAMWRFMDHQHPRHEAGPHEHAIRQGYALVDEYIGRMLNELPADTSTIVMSDHGFGPLHNMVNLNIYLMQKGLLKLKADAWTQLKSFAFQHGLTPSGAFKMASKMGIQNLATRVSKNTRNQIVGKFLSFDSVDWSRTVAYSMGHVGQVYLNVVGREPQGIVTEDDYEAKRAEVAAALHELKDENGRSLITDLIFREDTYHGPYSQYGPDLHLVLDDYNMIAYPMFATEGKVITQQIRGDSGCHRSEGIFIAQGPNIQQGMTLPESSILDLAPTILHLLGQEVPKVFDGRVLQEIFTEQTLIHYSDSEDNHTFADQSLATEDSAQVEERLRSLGYL
jgi:predicted AlkP superfamily phosphohydrolase/phosphomutase